MNLDDLDYFKSIDTRNLLAQIDGLPDQIELNWTHGQTLPLPNLESVTQVILCGMGGAAIAGELVAALTANDCRLSIHVCQTHLLPLWANSLQTLLIGMGDADETVAAIKQGQAAGCRVVRIEANLSNGLEVGYYLPMLLALLSRAGWIADYGSVLAEAASAMRQQQTTLRAESPVMRNPAKRMAGQFMDRYVLIFGAGLMGAAARYWAARVQAYAKAWAQAETLPAAAYTSLLGTQHPEALITKYMFVTLEAEAMDERNKAMSAAVREHFMTSGFNTDFIRGVGGSALAQLLTCLHYGEYVSYYLAMAYGERPK